MSSSNMTHRLPEPRNDPICNRCGYPRSRHEPDEYSGEMTECPGAIQIEF